MKRRITRIGLGLLVGAALGYGYWALIGCNTGTCPITSSPVTATVYGAVVGLVATGV